MIHMCGAFLAQNKSLKNVLKEEKRAFGLLVNYFKYLIEKYLLNFLKGDSGYPLEPWLLTPYRNARENTAESYFNDRFSKGRSIIERVFGVLKSRFRCLLAARELHYSPERVVQIMNVCCALHNICLDFNAPLFEVPERYISGEIEFAVHANEVNDHLHIATQIRNEIKNNLSFRS